MTRLLVACVFSAILVSSPEHLSADDYHNVNGFFGERAAGLAGAYTAIADDPSGAYYNPAGIAFAYDNFISISASTYRETRKSYVDVFGPDQSYSRTSRTYLPNFFGAVKSFGDYRFGFSIVSPSTDDYDQADRILFPLSLGKISSFGNDYTEKNTSLLAGPTLARSFGSRFSLGLSLFYLYDSNRITTSQLVSRKDGTYLSTGITDRRRTMGIEPVLGLQYMPEDSLSIGFSLRRPIVTSESRQKSGLINDSSGTAGGLTLSQSTTNASAAGNSGSVVVGPPENGGIPPTMELRSGVAFFPSRYLLLSGDFIYTTGYRKEIDRTQADVNGDVYLNPREVQSLTRRPVSNVAVGVEYYITENFAIRGGSFTNNANTYDIRWADGALAALARNASRNYYRVSTSSATGLYYNIPGTEPLERFEHVNLRGYSIGFSWGDARSSLTFTYVLEAGKGVSQIDSSQAPQKLIYRSSTVYLVASTRT